MWLKYIYYNYIFKFIIPHRHNTKSTCTYEFSQLQALSIVVPIHVKCIKCKHMIPPHDVYYILKFLIFHIFLLHSKILKFITCSLFHAKILKKFFIVY